MATLSETVEISLTSLVNSHNHEERSEGSQLLKSAVSTAARELAPEVFATFEASLFRRIFSMANSTDLNDKCGAVAGMSLFLSSEMLLHIPLFF